VAMIVAIDLANGSAARAFELGTETVTGRATHQIVGGPSGLDEALYVRLRRELAFRLSAPVVEDYVVADELDAQPMRLLGIDPFADSPFRSYLGGQNVGSAPDYLDDILVRPNTILLSQTVAERYGVASGDVLHIRRGQQTAALEIVGLLAPADDLSRRALDGLLMTDIATAQEVLDRVGRLDHIDLIIDAGPAGESVLQRIATILPPSARIQPVAARSGTVNEMTAAFNLNLTALSLLALVVGMFLIYNTVTFSVVQRRPVLGTLRSLGTTRREIYLMILGEAALLGLIGTALGLGLGIVLGRGMVQLVTQTINDLFFVVAVRELDVPVWTLVKGAVIGLAAALLGAALQARDRFELFQDANARKVLFGVVQTPEDLGRCAQLHARGFFHEVEHPVAGTLRYPGQSFHASESGFALRRRPPLLGEHTDEVLGGIGCTRDDLLALRREGVA